MVVFFHDTQPVMSWKVYVLESLRSGVRYVGISEDLNRRLKEHNSGKTKFTSGHMPWELLYQEETEDAASARAREKYLKSAAGRRFLDKKLNRE